jgi:hypothetical protein
MFIKVIEEYDAVLAKMDQWDKSYQQLYDLYQTLECNDIRLSQDFFAVLMAKLKSILELTREIERALDGLDTGLKETLTGRMDKMKDSVIKLHTSISTHANIKSRWVRIRVWYSGYYDGNTFIKGHVLHAAARELTSSPGHYGHISLETSKGYLSLWPVKAPRSPGDHVRPHFNSLYDDQIDEAPGPGVREADVTIELYSLDIDKINDFCRDYVRQAMYYALLPKKKTDSDKPADNCASVSLKALQQGGVEKLLENSSVEQTLLRSPSPNGMAEYLIKVQLREHRLFGDAISRLAAPPCVEVTEENPACFKATNFPLVVIRAYSPMHSQITLAVGDKLLLDDIANNGNLLCKIGDRRVLVPRSYVQVDHETIHAGKSSGPSTSLRRC